MCEQDIFSSNNPPRFGIKFLAYLLFPIPYLDFSLKRVNEIKAQIHCMTHQMRARRLSLADAPDAPESFVMLYLPPVCFYSAVALKGAAV